VPPIIPQRISKEQSAALPYLPVKMKIDAKPAIARSWCRTAFPGGLVPVLLAPGHRRYRRRTCALEDDEGRAHHAHPP
jgi:hypothetical protein